MTKLTEDAKALLARIRNVLTFLYVKKQELRETERSYHARNFGCITSDEQSMMIRGAIDSCNKVLDGKDTSYGLRDMEKILEPLANGEALSTSQYTFLEEAMEKREAELKEEEQNGKPRSPREQLFIESFWEKHCEEIKNAVVSSMSLTR